MTGKDLVGKQAKEDDPLRDLGEDQTKKLISDLSRTLISLLRLLRSRQGRVTQAPFAMKELHEGLTSILETHGEVHLKVAVDGLYLGRYPVLATSPSDDPAIFRSFQHGVRQFSFLNGLSIDELQSFVDTLSTELKQVQDVEEDLSILLADREFNHIHFVVVETFSEVGGGKSSEARSAELAEVVAAALRETLSNNLDIVGQTSGGTVRFWSADAAFFADDTVSDLVAAMPRSPVGTGATKPRDDEEINAFYQELETSLEHWTPWLLRSTLCLLDAADESEAGDIVRNLGTQLLVDARAHGLPEIYRYLEEVVHWLREGHPTAAVLATAVFSRPLYLLALAALKDDDPDSRGSCLLILEHLSSELRGKALAEACILPAGRSRRAAIDALMVVGVPPLFEVTDLVASVDAEAVRVLLHEVRQDQPNEELRAFHLAVLEHSDARIRATALHWLVHRQEGFAKEALQKALYDPSESVRGASLYLLAEKKPSYATDIVTDWFNSGSYKKAEMDEKRRGALVLVHLVGKELLPQMRKILRKFNVTGDQRIDEMRAAAVIVLGVLDDEESRKKINKLARSRLCGQALQEESKRVAAAMKAQRAPYPPPNKAMRKLAVDLGYIERPVIGEEPVSSDDFPRMSQIAMEASTAPRRRPQKFDEKDPSKLPTKPPGGKRRDSKTAPFHPRVGPRKDSVSPENEVVPREVVEELLDCYSFDDLPLYGLRTMKP